MNTKSIRFRLVCWYASISLLVAIAFSAYTYFRLEHYLREVLVESLERRARQIAEGIISQIPSAGEAFVAEEIEARYTPGKSDKFVRVTRDDGSLVYLSSMPSEGRFVPEQVPGVSRSAPFESRRAEIVLPNGVKLLAAVLPCQSGAHRYFVEVGATMFGNSHVLHEIALTLLAGLPVVMALAVFGGYMLIGRALAPVQRITRAAQDITLRHLDRRLPELETGDEIAGLTAAVNRMVARLEESFESNSRFTADASHDLRTPLTIMRGELESLVVDRDMPGVVREKLGSILEEIERLVKIVEGLFALSRLDSGEAQAERVQFDLAALAETTVEQMILLAEERRITLVCETSGVVEVRGDRNRLKQALVNLLDNAIKYTADGGRITLSVKTVDNLARVEVEDNGIGIQEEALPHIFKRFFRAPNVRAGSIDGFGLGLAIVQSIFNAHGGGISVVNTAPSGCRFTAKLPLIKPS